MSFDDATGILSALIDIDDFAYWFANSGGKDICECLSFLSRFEVIFRTESYYYITSKEDFTLQQTEEIFYLELFDYCAQILKFLDVTISEVPYTIRERTQSQTMMLKIADPKIVIKLKRSLGIELNCYVLALQDGFDKRMRKIKKRLRVRLPDTIIDLVLYYVQFDLFLPQFEKSKTSNACVTM